MSADVYHIVVRTDPLSIVQEKVRWLSRPQSTDVYHIVASLESYVYLLHHRIKCEPTGSTEPEDSSIIDFLLPIADYCLLKLHQQLHDEVPAIVALPNECQYVMFERRLANRDETAILSITVSSMICRLLVVHVERGTEGQSEVK